MRRSDRHRRWVLCATMASTMALASLPPLAGAATAATDDVHVLQAPSAVRYEPPRVSLEGGSADGVLLKVEGEDGWKVQRWDGTSVAVPATSDDLTLAGAMVVEEPWSAEPTEVKAFDTRTRTWDTTPVPAGTSLQGVTGDGLVLWAFAEQSLRLLPWSGGAAQAIEGWPAQTYPQWTITGLPAHDGTGMLLDGRIESVPQVVHAYYVDTAARRVVAMPDTAGSGGWLLGDTRIWWWASGQQGPAGVRSVPRPEGTNPAPAADDVRITPLADELRPYPQHWGDPGVVAAGDELVVLTEGGTRAQDRPLHVVAADGTVRELAPWAQAVASGGDGRVVVASGADPTDGVVERVVVATGVANVLERPAPIPARARALALEQGRLVVVDDSAAQDAVVELGWTGGATPAWGQRRTLGTGVGGVRTCHTWAEPCSAVAAGGGGTVWLSSEAEPTLAVLDAEGVRSAVPDEWATGGGLTGVDLPYVGWSSFWTNDHVVDVRDGHRPATGERSGVRDGVLWWGSSWDADRPAEKDLQTGATGWAPVPCASAWAGAGRWTPSCHGVTDVVSGISAPVFGARVGDGFAVVRSDNGGLAWTDLAQAFTDGAPTWHALGTALDDAAAVAVSAEGEPTVAWIDDDGLVHLAFLPVTPSGATWRHPTGPSEAPAAPTGVAVTAVGDARATLRWDPVAPASQPVGYLLVVDGATNGTAIAGGASTGTVRLVNGRTQTVGVRAVNLVGASDATNAAPVRPLAANPPAPRNLTATVDPVTSAVTVTWSWTDDGISLPLKGFSVVAGDTTLAEATASARSATGIVAAKGTWEAYVIAYSDSGWGWSRTVTVTVPGLDRTPPTVALTALPVVSWGPTVDVTAIGTDDRRLTRYDALVRSAGSGAALGGWRPLSASTTGRWRLSTGAPGTTTCVTVRAVDHASQVSAWSAPSCTVVPLDDRATARRGSWRLPANSAYYASTASVTTTAGASLTRDRIRTDLVALVVTRCPTCGVARVYDDGTLIASVDLRASVTLNRQVVVVSKPGARRSGRITVTSGASRRTLLVDGIVLRSW